MGMVTDRNNSGNRPSRHFNKAGMHTLELTVRLQVAVVINADLFSTELNRADA